MSHPGGGLTKDYHDNHDSATTSFAAASECVLHPGGELTKDYHDNHDSGSDRALHPSSGLTKDYHDGEYSATTSAAPASDRVSHPDGELVKGLPPGCDTPSETAAALIVVGSRPSW